MGKFIIKHIDNRKPQVKAYPSHAQKTVTKENKKKVDEQVMTTSEKIEMAKNVLNSADQQASVKRVKRDKGLIERTESSKTILTEDNKELLND
jgi:phage terminase large subunit-like protein